MTEDQIPSPAGGVRVRVDKMSTDAPSTLRKWQTYAEHLLWPYLRSRRLWDKSVPFIHSPECDPKHGFLVGGFQLAGRGRRIGSLGPQ